jgi:hydrogenase expression/formation protein HypE
MRALIEEVFLDRAALAERPDILGASTMDDGAAIKIGDRWLVMSTDSHVVKPIFFPGGDIGRLSVSGTVNDLAMMGATEVLALSCAVILEEGFPRLQLEAIEASIRSTCKEARCLVVTGDTKVMPRGEIDGIVLNTTGVALTKRVVEPCGLRPGDALIVTGTIADHGMAVMVRRHDLALEGDLASDVAPLNGLIHRALEVGGTAVVALKDPTRGGVASALHELADRSGIGILIEEARLPIRPEVRGACELLGIDPLHVANEGKALIGVHRDAVDRVLDVLRSHPYGKSAAVIGTCTEEYPGRVAIDTGVGRRLVSEPDGEPLPRIC